MKLHWIVVLGAGLLCAVQATQAVQVRRPTGRAATVSPQALIGKTVPPLPAGLEDVGGACIDVEGVPTCTYSLGAYGKVTADGGADIAFYAGRRGVPSTESPTDWEVMDAIAAPVERRGYLVVFGTCRLDGRGDTGLVAQVRQSGDEILRRAVWARRFDTASGRFVDVDLRRVDCVNEGYGL